MIVRLTAGARRRAIARIMDARLLLFAFGEIRDTPQRPSPARRMSRGGIHDQAALEKERLQRAPDAQLCAELADLPPAS